MIKPSSLVLKTTCHLKLNSLVLLKLLKQVLKVRMAERSKAPDSRVKVSSQDY